LAGGVTETHYGGKRLVVNLSGTPYEYGGTSIKPEAYGIFNAQ